MCKRPNLGGRLPVVEGHMAGSGPCQAPHPYMGNGANWRPAPFFSLLPIWAKIKNPPPHRISQQSICSAVLLFSPHTRISHFSHIWTGGETCHDPVFLAGHTNFLFYLFLEIVSFSQALFFPAALLFLANSIVFFIVRWDPSNAAPFRHDI